MADDWRIRIEVDEAGHAEGLLERLDAELGGEARELARELEKRRLAVSRDGDTIFVRARIWLGQDVEIHVRLAGGGAPGRPRAGRPGARPHAVRVFRAGPPPPAPRPPGRRPAPRRCGDRPASGTPA